MNSNSQLKYFVITWGIAAIILSIVFVVFNSAPLVVRAGLFASVLAAVAGAALGTVGAVIADAIRRFAHPDMIITDGGFFSLLGAKLFWKIGPQLIGLVGGVALGIALVLK
jgi:hypothetical protein